MDLNFVFLTELRRLRNFQATRVWFHPDARHLRDHIDDRVGIGCVRPRHGGFVGTVRAPPRSDLYEKIFVRVAVLRTADGVNDRIDDGRAPCRDRCHHVCERIFRLLVENIHDHQREEAHDEAQEDHQHHDGQPQIVLVAEELQLAFTRRRRVELVKLRVLLPDGVEDARVGNDDDQARQQESHGEDEGFGRFAELLDDGAGEGLRLVA